MVFDELLQEIRAMRQLMLRFEKGVNDLSHQIEELRRDIREIIEAVKKSGA